MPSHVYGLRVLGMGLGALPVGLLLQEMHAPWHYWAWAALCCLVWPHAAYLRAHGSATPFRVERGNLVVDSIIAGSMVPIMHFCLLPSVLLLTVATADKISTGIRGLWLRAAPAMVLGLLATGLVTGFVWDPETSMPVLVASLPILVIHTLAVSLYGYRLVRRVQRQNLRLDELYRLDGLTRLESRAHWLSQAEATLRRHKSDALPATLILIDVDHFKDINDRYGHATGDDVLRAIADAIHHLIPLHSHAGRLGGDEIAIILPLALADAAAVAARIDAAVESLEFPRFPALRCSISIGLSELPPQGLSLREWSEAADHEMYRAKRARHSGRAPQAPAGCSGLPVAAS
ncbi:diguanylate cyclase [Tahibacter aquaticus]|uniref:diguanylate cyclase n=1 Tax=Tahibacter aquaticus TaxID=520092 RepID=UPI001AADE537|nr:diguanylate cyclase [Tahibacter aquaticus]